MNRLFCLVAAVTALCLSCPALGSGPASLSRTAPAIPEVSRAAHMADAFADALGLGEYWRVGEGVEVHGDAIDLTGRHGFLGRGEEVPDRGIWYVMPGTVLVAPGGSSVVVQEAVIVYASPTLVDDDGVDGAAPKRKLECETSCPGANYFACCWIRNGAATCRCVKRGRNDNHCQSGGEGSDYCSIAETTY